MGYKKKSEGGRYSVPGVCQDLRHRAQDGKMVERDLASAREVWINESNSDAEHEFREESNYLKYVNSLGKFADFH